MAAAERGSSGACKTGLGSLGCQAVRRFPALLRDPWTWACSAVPHSRFPQAAVTWEIRFQQTNRGFWAIPPHVGCCYVNYEPNREAADAEQANDPRNFNGGMPS